MVQVRPKELERAGVSRVERITSIKDGNPVTEDRQILEVANLIWCTGYRPGFDWIDLPVFDSEGRLLHEREVVPSMPGLYLVGLFFLHALWSETITGVQSDVKHIIKHLRTRQPETTPSS